MRDRTARLFPLLLFLFATLLPGALVAQTKRARDLGIAPGIFTPGPWNAITDVAGVLVGHETVVVGDSVRTGVTAIFPHEGDLFHERVPAAITVGNGFGKLLGSTQVNELGELETPILLTCTLCVWRAADALVAWALARPGMEEIRSINPVVAETNDGFLNAIRARPIDAANVRHALEAAASGPVAEGSVGAGTGTIAFGWKGGIGTSSRRLPARLGGWTVGVLVQTNFGGVLQVLGVPVGKALGRYAFRRQVEDAEGDGSIIMIVATDAPLDHRNLRRLAERALLGMGRTGSSASNGSGDYVIAFSTSPAVRRRTGETRQTVESVANDAMSAVFEAVIEATEESIYNSLIAATTVSSRAGTIDPLPLAELQRLLVQYGAATR